MASLFEAYITNLGKYNEGELVGETLKFPTTIPMCGAAALRPRPLTAPALCPG